MLDPDFEYLNYKQIHQITKSSRSNQFHIWWTGDFQIHLKGKQIFNHIIYKEGEIFIIIYKAGDLTAHAYK